MLKKKTNKNMLNYIASIIFLWYFGSHIGFLLKIRPTFHCNNYFTSKRCRMKFARKVSSTIRPCITKNLNIRKTLSKDILLEKVALQFNMYSHHLTSTVDSKSLVQHFHPRMPWFVIENPGLTDWNITSGSKRLNIQ